MAHVCGGPTLRIRRRPWPGLAIGSGCRGNRGGRLAADEAGSTRDPTKERAAARRAPEKYWRGSWRLALPLCSATSLVKVERSMGVAT